MPLKAVFQALICEEDGAVTVDFVVLTAAICMAGFTAVNAFEGATRDIANDIAANIGNVEVP
ncbi:MAG: hypothetical protein AAGF56_12470 [Pseudomonadota bacterium]